MFFTTVANYNVYKVDAPVYMRVSTQKQVKYCSKGKGRRKKSNMATDA